MAIAHIESKPNETEQEKNWKNTEGEERERKNGKVERTKRFESSFFEFLPTPSSSFFRYILRVVHPFTTVFRNYSFFLYPLRLLDVRMMFA